MPSRGSCDGKGKVTVYCHKCGKELGTVNPKVSGHRKIGCPKCGAVTDVEIRNGHVNTY